MSNTKQGVGTPVVKVRAWRVRLLAVSYFTALITLVAPLTPVRNPPLEPAQAQVIEMDYKAYASAMGKEEYNWGTKQFECLDYIWTKESHWNPLADNPHSSAYGIAQMLGEDSRNGYEQVRNGLRYVEHRYGNPCNAKAFWEKKKWY